MQAVVEWNVTTFYCVGVMPTLQPESVADRKHSLRRVGCSGIPRDLHRMIEDRWGVPWSELFGMTETGLNIGASANRHEDLVGSGSMGTAFPCCDVVVVDEDATSQAWTSADGSTSVVAAKELTRRGDENISQAEVEFALQSHEDVLDCAVNAVPDHTLGEEALWSAADDSDSSSRSIRYLMTPLLLRAVPAADAVGGRMERLAVVVLPCELLGSCTIITTTPNELVAPVHNRMPAILTSLRLTDTKTFTCGVVAPTYAVAAGAEEGGAN
jgi:hypothetical protein